MSRWSLTQQQALRAHRPPSPVTALERVEFIRKAGGFLNLEEDQVLEARRPGTNGPDDPGNLKNYRDTRIGTAAWTEEHLTEKGEAEIHRIVPNPNNEGLAYVIHDGVTGEEIDPTPHPLQSSGEPYDAAIHPRMGTPRNTG